MPPPRAEVERVRKPLLCRLNLHQWFVDSAWFYSAECCGRCGEYRDLYALDRLMRERKLWDEAPKEGGFMGSAGWVAERLHG